MLLYADSHFRFSFAEDATPIRAFAFSPLPLISSDAVLPPPIYASRRCRHAALRRRRFSPPPILSADS